MGATIKHCCVTHLYVRFATQHFPQHRTILKGY